MSKFVVIYRSPSTEDVLLEDAARARTEAEVRASIPWADEAGEQLADRGMLLGNPHEVTHTGVSVAIVNGSATGYAFIEAANMEQATALMQKHPHLNNAGAVIEVYEALPWPEVS